MRALVVIVIGTLFAESAAASEPQVWAAEPTKAETMAAWPPGERPGDATAICVVQPDYSLGDCQVAVERGEGSGHALFTLVPKYRLKPYPAGGQKPGTRTIVSASWPVPDTIVEWKNKPSDVAMVYSPQAMHSPAGGASIINCLAGTQGGLLDCRVAVESPPGMGYGWMGWRVTPFLSFKPATYQGQPIRSMVNIPFYFPPGPRAPKGAATGMPKAP
jgi:hypothetical protein